MFKKKDSRDVTIAAVGADCSAVVFDVQRIPDPAPKSQQQNLSQCPRSIADLGGALLDAYSGGAANGATNGAAQWAGDAGADVDGDDGANSDADDNAAGAGVFQSAIYDDPELLTDFGNAAHFLRRFGHITRYVEERGRFFCYESRRGKWCDRQSIADRRAAEIVRGLKNAYAPTANTSKATAQFKHYLACQKPERRKAILTLARCEIAIDYEAFDADPMLLNVANGAIDLRTGAFLAHSPALMCSKISRVKFDAEAKCPRWTQFLSEIFAGDAEIGDAEIGDAELIEFVQRAIGYSLTGLTREQVFFLLYGIGKNGKSTFLNVLRALMGEYGTAAQMDTFSERGRQSNGHNEDLARLRGARFVSAVETEESRRLAEGTIKQVTGGDPVAASYKGEHVFTYTPAYKIWLAANHKPVIRGTDEGIWRRVLLIPFMEQFETDPEKAKQPEKRKADMGLEAALLAELPGILNWAIEGCLDWQAEGLPRPKVVSAAVENYRSDSDALGQYLEERTIIGDHCTARAGELYTDYSK